MTNPKTVNDTKIMVEVDPDNDISVTREDRLTSDLFVDPRSARLLARKLLKAADKAERNLEDLA